MQHQRVSNLSWEGLAAGTLADKPGSSCSSESTQDLQRVLYVLQRRARTLVPDGCAVQIRRRCGRRLQLVQWHVVPQRANSRDRSQLRAAHARRAFGCGR